MKDCRLFLSLFSVAMGMIAMTAQGQPSRFLYTEPDPDAEGGIEGRIARPAQPIRQILASAPTRPEKVYVGEVRGSDRQSFRFTGLPMDRYDLFVIYDDRFYEGFQLLRGQNTLTRKDKAQIEDILDRSEPFFNVKIIHRLEGETGRGNEARAVCTFGRTGLRRTYKLALLRQVGPGWQVKRTRELYPRPIGQGVPIETDHEFSPALSRIRVTGQIRNLGDLNL